MWHIFKHRITVAGALIHDLIITTYNFGMTDIAPPPSSNFVTKSLCFELRVRCELVNCGPLIFGLKSVIVSVSIYFHLSVWLIIVNCVYLFQIKVVVILKHTDIH